MSARRSSRGRRQDESGAAFPVHEYVDTHVHLDTLYKRLKKPFDYPFADLVRSFAPGFEGCVTLFRDSWEATLNFIDKEDLVFGALGVHPHQAQSYDDAMEEQLRANLGNRGVVAVGETGLDYHYDFCPRDVQQAVFERQLRLAVSVNKPIVIHTREAEHDTFDILQRVVSRDHKIHFHCYTDSFWLCEQTLGTWPNVYFGFTGALTFPSSQHVCDLCARVPLNRVLAETDGPFMAPVPFRGRPANPGHIPYVIRKIAELHGVDDATAFRTLRENCRDFYGF
jgi:TatD DNase family protein